MVKLRPVRQESAMRGASFQPTSRNIAGVVRNRDNLNNPVIFPVTTFVPLLARLRIR